MNEHFSENAPAGKTVKFAWRDWLALGLGLGLAALWFSVFGLEVLFEGQNPGGGVGPAVFVFALFAAVLIRLGRRAVWNRATVSMLAAVLLLALSLVLFGDPRMALINCFMILCVGAMEIFALSGKAQRAWHEAGVLWDTVKLGLTALFTHFPKPFQALGALDAGGKKRAWGILAGFLIAVPLLYIVIFLLSSADQVFGSLFSGLGAWFEKIGLGRIVWRVLRAAVLGLMFFSALYFLTQPGKAPPEPWKTRRVSAAPFVTVLALMDAVYLLFVAIQFAFLFGGRETAAMSGGYAEYARSGFFQLVAVSLINLGAALATASGAAFEGGAKPALRALGALLLGLTCVILVSAVRRMGLYISAYGLSFLRALTLWGMALIAVLTVAAAVKLFRPAFRFWPVFFAVGLAGWLAFSYINIDARIANYNVDTYLDGRLEDVDIYYLQNLSPEALPALERLRDAVGGDYTGAGDSDFYIACDLDDAIRHLENQVSGTCAWRDWWLGYVRYGEN